MCRQKNDTQDGNESQASFEAMLREKLQQAVRTALMSVLEEEDNALVLRRKPRILSGSGQAGIASASPLAVLPFFRRRARMGRKR